MFNQQASPRQQCSAHDAEGPLSAELVGDTAECARYFDADWYVGAYADVALSGLSPYEHYLRFGRFLNRPPCHGRPATKALVESTAMPAAQRSSPVSETDTLLSRRSAGLLRGGFNLPGKEVPIIRGWLAEIGNTRPRSARVEIGSAYCLTTVCDGFRTDLLDNGINDGRHGFELILPIELVDGKPHALALIDEETGRVLAEEVGIWTQERSFSDFAGFLAASFVSPLIYAPFREEDKRCFAVMENIADYLAGLATALKSGPLVSVIMPVHDRLAVVQEAVDSVMSQSYGNFELILIDDGSTDGTLNLLRCIEKLDRRVVLLHHPDCRGVSIARNSGLARAKGELICYLDSDNAWDPRYIAATVGAFLHLPDAQAVYGGQMLFRGTQPHPFAVRFGSFNRGLLENRNYIDLNVFAHRRAALRQIGFFDEELARFVDWDFILRAAETVRMYSVPVLLSHYRYDKAINTLTNAAQLMGQLEGVRGKTRRRNAGRAQSAAAPGGPRKKKLSVIIPSFEALPDLEECIQSVLDARSSLGIELIVIDNASGAPVQRYLEALATSGHIRYRRNPVNYGYTRAVNLGLYLAAQGSDVLLLNNDAVLEADAIDALHAAAYRLPQCGLTVPRQVLPGGTRTLIDHVPYACPEQDCDVNLSKHHANVVDAPVFHHGDYTELSFAPFFCVYIKREVLDRVPRLDEKHGRHYRSDRIFCDYVRQVLRFRMYHVSAAKVRHKLQRSTDILQRASLQGRTDFREICLDNRWSPEMSRQFGYEAEAWQGISP